MATSAEQYDDLWRLVGLSGQAPEIDFDTEIVIWFGAVYGSDCPIRLDDVVSDIDRQLVYGRLVLPGNPVGCQGDANGQSYVVSVARDRLPTPPFTVQLSVSDPPPGAPERTTVTADLRQPGLVAGPGDLRSGVEAAPGDGPGEFRPGVFIEAPGYPSMFSVRLECVLGPVGPFNGLVWSPERDDLAENPSAAWADGTRSGRGVAEFTILDDGPRLQITINDHPEFYGPVSSLDTDVAVRCS